MSEGVAKSGSKRRAVGISGDEGSAASCSTGAPAFPLPSDYTNCFTSGFNYNEKFGENAKVRVFTSGMAYSIASDCIQEIKKTKQWVEVEKYGSMRNLCVKYMEDIFRNAVGQHGDVYGNEVQLVMQLFLRESKVFIDQECRDFPFRNFWKLSVAWEGQHLHVLVPLTRDQWSLEKMHFADDHSMLMHVKYMISHFSNFDKKTASAGVGHGGFVKMFGEVLEKDGVLQKIVEANIEYLNDLAISTSWEMEQKKKEYQENPVFEKVHTLQEHCKYLEKNIEREKMEKDDALEKTKAVQIAISMDRGLAEQNMQRISARFDESILQMQNEYAIFDEEFKRVFVLSQQEKTYLAFRDLEVQMKTLTYEKETMQALLLAVKQKGGSAKTFVESVKEKMEEEVASNECLSALENLSEEEAQALKKLLLRIVQHKYLALESLEYLQRGIGSLFGK